MTWASLAVFWLLLTLIHLLDWGLGLHRGVALIALLLFVLLKGEAGDRIPSPTASRLLRYAALLWLAIAIGALIYGLLYASPNDIGESGVRAIEGFLADFSNPYATTVDKVNISRPGYFFEGYKYLPLTLLLYMPAVSMLGESGVYITNFLYYGGTIWVIHRIATHLHQVGQLTDPIVPAVLYMSSGTILFENFIGGVNDGAIAFFAMASLLAVLKSRDAAAGLLLGCAVGTKWPVGGLFLLVLLPQVKKRLIFCLLVALIPAVTILPFVLWDLTSFVSNTVVFFWFKPPDSTGFLTRVPIDWLKQTIRIGLFLSFWGTWVYYAKRSKSRDGRHMVVFLTILMTIFILIPLENHRNHLMWLIPLLALCYGPWKLLRA